MQRLHMFGMASAVHRGDQAAMAQALVRRLGEGAADGAERGDGREDR